MNSDEKFIPVNKPLLQNDEASLLVQCIDTGWISSEGPFVKEFETKFSGLVGRKHGVSVSSGTAALDIAIAALGIGKGDEVILPAFTIISCISQIVRLGAVPVLVDSDPYTWNMNVSEIESKITERTKMIIMVHIYGLTVDVDPVLMLAEKHGLMVLEDAAEAIGHSYNGKPCGSFGDVSVFSFYANKNLTTGEGGMVVTNSSHLAGRCKELRNLCFNPEKRFVHDELGWNYRLTNLQAALGVSQLSRLEKILERKKWIGRSYRNLLSDIPGLRFQPDETSYTENLYWVFGILLDQETNLDAEKLISNMAKNGIGCRPFFCPMHEQPVLKELGLFKGEAYPVSENLYRMGLYIPSGLGISESEINRVADQIRKELD